jgi:hypothetical protein
MLVHMFRLHSDMAFSDFRSTEHLSSGKFGARSRLAVILAETSRGVYQSVQMNEGIDLQICYDGLLTDSYIFSIRYYPSMTFSATVNSAEVVLGMYRPATPALLTFTHIGAGTRD